MADTIRTITVHPAQVAEILKRKAEFDAAAARFADAVSLVALGHGITEGELQTIDTDRNVLTIAVADPAGAVG